MLRKCVLNKIFLALTAVLGVNACKSSQPPAPPPPAVVVSHPVEQQVTEWDQFPGRLQAPQTVTVNARVSGVIEAAPFQEGAAIKAGDVIFVIDDRPFRADYLSKEADIAKADSQVAQAEAHFKRYDKLQGTRAISAEDYDEALAALRQAKANLGVAKAALTVSRLNLEWTKVIAPISGRISRKLVTEGNLVSPAAALTTITSVDPMYVYINIPERSLQKYRQLTLKQGTNNSSAKLPCLVQLENETTWDHKGWIDFIDNHVDTTTGTLEVRGVIPNADESLTAGLFAKVKIPGTEARAALLVPDLAIGTDQNTRYVTVLGPENVVETRPVKLGALFGKLRAITAGISTNDLVVVNGLQQARPKTKVAPTEAPIDQELLKEAMAAATPAEINIAANLPPNQAAGTHSSGATL